MFKVKQKIATLLAAFLTAIFAIVLAFGTITATPKTTAKAAETTVVDTLTVTTTGRTGTSYGDWNGKTDKSTAVYAGQSAAGNSSIQLRSDNSNSGVITTASGGRVAKIVVTWYSGTANGRTLNIYGKNTAYTAATDLYSASTYGKLLGTIVKGTSTELTITGDYAYIGFRSDSKALYLSKVEITWEVASDCTHENKTYVEAVAATCTEAGKIAYYACPDCETNFSDEACTQPVENLVDPNAPAKGHTKDENNYTYTPNDENGTHTVKSVCTVEGCDTEFTVDEAEQCNVEAEYVREGNTHTQTGTCTRCGASTSVIEDCTLGAPSYEALDTDNGAEQKHNVTTYCSVCEQYETVEEACSFGDGVLDGTTLTFTCEHCAYSYSKTVATYTVTYSTPNGENTETVIENKSLTFGALEGYDNYTFVGWVTEKVDPATEEKPETIYTAGSTYTITEDGVVFYALYSYTDGVEGWNLVTDVNQLTVGSQIVITDKDGKYALSTYQKTSNRGAVIFNANNLSEDGDDTYDVQKITLKAGKATGEFAFYVGDDGYLYAGSSSGNQLKTRTTLDVHASWKITISNGVTSISAPASSNRNVMQFNPNNGTPIFACYTSASQTALSIYLYSSATTYYVTPSKVCEHTNTYEETLEEATCTKVGYKQFYCEECSAPVGEPIEIPMIDHDFQDGVCTGCGAFDPAIDYSGYYYIAFTQDGNLLYVNNTTWKSNHYTAEQFDASSFNVNYIFQLVKVDTGLYKITEWDGGNIAAYDGNVTVERVGDVFYFKNADDNYLSLNHSDTYDYVRFYSNSYPKDITLTPVALASFDEASVTVGTDIKVNYYVTIPEAIAESVVFNYKIGDSADIYEAKGVLVGEQYKFSLAIGPHLMTETLTAWISLDSTTLALHNTLSIRSYAQVLLNNAEYTTGLKQLVSDMLRYGAAAQKYQSHKVDDLATAVDDILTGWAATPTESYSLVKNSEATEFPVFFKGASVWFGDVNRIRVSFKLADGVAFEDLENVTLTIGENTVVLTSIDYTYVTEGILATELDKEFTFVLSCNGVELQTLTYSVAAYAKQMQSNPNMSELALALYRYGESAKAYQASPIA